MPNNILKSLGIVLCGTVFGYSMVQFLKPEMKNRHIASAMISKLGQEQNARSLFDVKLNLDGIGANDQGISELKVSVIALKNIRAGLMYNWNLPTEVQIMEGAATEALGEFTVGQSRDFVLHVRGFSKQSKRFISFEVQGEINQYPIKREVLISSRMEDSLEYLIQQNELGKEKKAGINKLGTESKGRFDPENVVR